tara:strand:- start:143 stop:1063 length:921 start_codon:yes stop_codon:yes gene_type:complete
MRNLLTTLILITMFNTYAQSVVYDRSGSKKRIIKDELIISLEVRKQNEADFYSDYMKESSTLLSLLPLGVDLAFKSIENYLDKNKEKFSGEYIGSVINEKLRNRKLPNVIVERKIRIEGSEDSIGLSFKLNAERVDPIFPLAYYELDFFELNYSKAKTTSKHNKLNYSIQITPILYLSKIEEKGKDKEITIIEKKELETTPITINMVEFDQEIMKDRNKKNYRTGLFNLPKDAVLAEVKIEIVETNPAKVKAEKLLEFFNSNKDDIKTIVNNYLPKQDASSDGDSTGAQTNENNGGTGNSNSSVSN